MLRKLGVALSGGLMAGSFVGGLEALYVLQAMTPTEYQALVYAVGLYGLAGAGLGLGLGLPLLLSAASPGRRWALVASLVFFGLGQWVSRAVLSSGPYGGLPLPGEVVVGVLAAVGLAALLHLWIGTRLLTRTPLGFVVTARGTVIVWGSGAALAAVFSAMPAPGAAGDPAPARDQGPEFEAKPDIVLVAVDGLRADAIEPWAPAGTSPALRSFANEALAFDSYVVSSSWARPSVASLFTSRLPSAHGATRRDRSLDPGLRTLAELLQEGGYVTGGLPNSTDVSAARGFGQGFDWYPFRPTPPGLATETTASLSLYPGVRRLLGSVERARRVQDFYAPAEEQVDAALRFLDDNRERRVFLFLHLREPHEPWFAHPYDGRAWARLDHPHAASEHRDEMRAAYAGEVAHLDEQLGRLFEGLRTRGRHDGAAVVIASTHGTEFFEHGGWGEGTSLYDELIQVPLLMKLPGGVHGAARVPWQVRDLDVAPTLAVLAGLEPDPGWVGAELLDARFDADLTVHPPPELGVMPGRPEAWATHTASRDAVSELDLRGRQLQSLRRGGRKVIESLRPGEPPVRWYDLVADPGEQHNLDGQGQSEEVAAQAALERLISEARASREPEEQLDEAERARLCELGYLSGADCMLPTEP